MRRGDAFLPQRWVRDQALTRTLRSNHGLITTRALMRLGYSATEVRGLVRHGDLRRLHRGVYVDGRTTPSDHAHLRAALLAVSGTAWLSGRGAAMAWGLEPVSLPRIEVTAVAASTPRHPGLRIRRASRLPPSPELRRRRGLRVSSIPRLLIECAAAGARDDHLQRLIEQAAQRDLLDLPDLIETLERHVGHAGTGRLRRACDAYLPHRERRSGLERAFDRWLARHPEIPPPDRNVRLGPWEIDCHWPEPRLALELDGRPYHVMIRDIERDRRKDAWLQAEGQRVLRVTDARFRSDRPGVHRDLAALLGLRPPTKPAGASS